MAPQESSKDVHLKTLLDASNALTRRDTDSAVTAWLECICNDFNWAIGEVWSYSGRFFRLEYTWFHPLSTDLAEFSTISRRLNPPFDRTTLGIACQSDTPLYIPNFPAYSR